MPNIKSIRIDWMEGCGNDPRFVVEWDEEPALDTLRYQSRKTQHGVTYLGLAGEYANFAHWSPGNETGYGGKLCEFKLEDGEVDKRKGPWSSNSDWINQLWPLTRVVEVTWGYTSGAATEAGVIRACREAGIPLVRVQLTNHLDSGMQLQPLRAESFLPKNADEYAVIERLV